MVTRGDESPLRRGPEEYLCDYEREPLNNVSIRQEMKKSLGVNHIDLFKKLFFTILFLCVYVNYETNYFYNILQALTLQSSLC